MNIIWRGGLTVSALALYLSVCHAQNSQFSFPGAGARPHAQNYKDMILATCVANAYQNDKSAAIDAGSSVSALRDWTEYDMERAPDAIKSLVDSYLVRNYHNPLVEPEIKDVRFDFLKFLDLYHSSELDEQTKDLVINPEHKYRQDNQ